MKRIFSILIVFSFVLNVFAIAPLRPDQKEIRIVQKTDEFIEIENMRWGFPDGNLDSAVFKRTKIYFDNIENVYYWSKNFPPKYIGAHGMLMFKMRSSNDVIADDGSKDIGFVVSVEAWLRTDQSYSIFGGMLPGKYPLIYTVTSYKDGIQRAINVGKLTIGQYKLELTPEQKRQLVVNSLIESAKDKSDTSYHTTRNSCVTCAFDLLNDVLTKDKRLRMWIIPKVLRNPRVVLPRLAPRYLLSKKISKKMDAFYDIDSKIRLKDDGNSDYILNVSELPGNYTRSIKNNIIVFNNMLSDYFITVSYYKELVLNKDDVYLSEHIVNELSTQLERQEEEILSFIETFPSTLLSYYFDNDFDKYEYSEILNDSIKESYPEFY